MAELGVEAARWMVSRALGTASGGLLEAWAASTELGENMEALRMELLYAEGMLNNARGRGHGHGPEIQNPALMVLLQKLRHMAYRADDVMDELEYFRVQDELDGTYHAAEEHGGGCLRNHVLNARHTARNIRKLIGFTNCSHSSASHNEPDEDTSRGVYCGAIGPCAELPGFSKCHHSSTDHNIYDEENKEDASRGVLCGGAVWPCARASSAPAPPPNQGCQEVQNGGMARIISSARGTIHTVSKYLPCSSISHIQNATNSSIPSTRRGFLCCARPIKAPRGESVIQAPKLKFDRVEMSRKMKDIVEQLKPLCAKVSTILNLELLDSSRSIAQGIGTSLDTLYSKGQWLTPVHKNALMSRPVTTPESIEPRLYGRNYEKDGIIDDITKGKYCQKDLIILPIVGPGGIGKTTLTQCIYKELENHFEAKLWVCVSVSFSVPRLTCEISDKLKKNREGDPDKTIEEELKSKRFLLVLDDMWNCSNVDEWNRFLVPFTKGQKKGSAILVTTRFPALAQMVKTTNHWIDLKGLDKDEFMKLFKACAFGDIEPEKEHSELLKIGNEIVQKLKGSPLAAKTVGRLLRNNLDLSHWRRVLESKEWESQNGEHDIMPALKLSFDYLAFHLQQCFTYCALFPEDYKFSEEELIHFWIGQDLLHSHGEYKSIEDIGLNYLIELVNHGFFKKEEDEQGSTFYIIHDLLHELAIKVSAEECLSLCISNNLRSLQISPSIRHLSINIDESSVKDRKTFDHCKEYFIVLGKRLKVENLHSLMLFGKQHGSFVKTFQGLLGKAKSLRLIFISGGKYRVEDLFHNFLNLVHLRYLRIHNNYPWEGPQPPMDMSRFYHLRVLDLRGCKTCPGFSRHLSNLIKLRHFLVPDDEMHAGISEVGGLKSLQGLRKCVVGKENKGFELRQIGDLLELRKSLLIDRLENVETMEEAEEAKLMHKRYLRGLTFNWNAERSNMDPLREEQVLEGLKPHSDLLELSIIGHGGCTCPSWLVGLNLSVKNLESLCLNGVAWKIFPRIGELRLVNEPADEISSNIPGQQFNNLKKIGLLNLARLERWVVGGELLSHLEVLIIEDCPELVELSFLKSTCSQQEQKQISFPRSLQVLRICNCPKLLSLPPVPWTGAPCSVYISGVGLALKQLQYSEAKYLLIAGDDHAQDVTAASFWTALDSHKLTGVESLEMERCPPPPLDALQKLSSNIKSLKISNCKGVSGKELTQVLSCLPKLSELKIHNREKITWLGVQEKEATSSCREEEEIAPEGLLLLPPQLQNLQIWGCPELSLRRDSAHGENGGGLQALSSLRSLFIFNCPKFLACYSPSPSSSCFPFPTSLQSLHLRDVGMLAPLSNLASLTGLSIDRCGGSETAGLGRLLAHGCLHRLDVTETPNLFHIDTLEGMYQLQSLFTDDVAGVLAAPICTRLSSSLITLTFILNKELERFTEEQGEALQRLTSLQEFRLWNCQKLTCLPPGLQNLTSLKTLEISNCPCIRSLPKDGLPNSLQKLSIQFCPSIRALPKDGLPNSLQILEIGSCPSIRSLPKDGLPNSLQKLIISYCPSIRALPKGGLPSSLQELYVSNGNSEELTRQCHKLIGTIPIVKT